MRKNLVLALSFFSLGCVSNVRKNAQIETKLLPQMVFSSLTVRSTRYSYPDAVISNDLTNAILGGFQESKALRRVDASAIAIVLDIGFNNDSVPYDKALLNVRVVAFWSDDIDWDYQKFFCRGHVLKMEFKNVSYQDFIKRARHPIVNYFSSTPCFERSSRSRYR